MWMDKRKRYQILKINLFAVLSLVFISFKPTLSQIPAGGIVRDCNSQAILDHISTGHTYCFHVCGFLTGGTPPGGATVPTCNANGDCVCQCIPGQPQATLDNTICPGPVPDPDPTALPACQARCQTTCAGGTAQVCEESVGITNNGLPAIAKVCACSCPTNSCPGVTTTTTSTTTTTTTTIPPPTVVPASVVVLKVWKPKFLYLWKKFKLYYFTWIVFLKKLAFIYFLCLFVNIIGIEVLSLFWFSEPMLALSRFLSNYVDQLLARFVSALANFVLRDLS